MIACGWAEVGDVCRVVKVTQFTGTHQFRHLILSEAHDYGSFAELVFPPWIAVTFDLHWEPAPSSDMPWWFRLVSLWQDVYSPLTENIAVKTRQNRGHFAESEPASLKVQDKTQNKVIKVNTKNILSQTMFPSHNSFREHRSKTIAVM